MNIPAPLAAKTSEKGTTTLASDAILAALRKDPKYRQIDKLNVAILEQLVPVAMPMVAKVAGERVQLFDLLNLDCDVIGPAADPKFFATLRTQYPKLKLSEDQARMLTQIAAEVATELRQQLSYLPAMMAAQGKSEKDVLKEMLNSANFRRYQANKLTYGDFAARFSL